PLRSTTPIAYSVTSSSQESKSDGARQLTSHLSPTDEPYRLAAMAPRSSITGFDPKKLAASSGTLSGGLPVTSAKDPWARA
ncbi:hypothetical protein LTR16_011139, partial [Cryomyces antarcticus]